MVKRYAIGDVLEIKHGFAFSGEHIVTSDNGVVLVTPGNFRIGGGFQENKCKFYSGDYPAEYVLPAGTHIVTMTDLSKEIDTLGYSAIVPASERTYLHNQRIGRIVYKDNCIYPLYMHYLMRTRDYQRFVANSSSGATVHHTSPDKICKYEFSAPSRARQEEIADFLHAYDALIENNRRQIKLLEEAAQRLYKEWFVDLRFPGHEHTPIVDGIPQGWRYASVTDLLDVRYGKDHKSIESGRFPVYGSGGVMRYVNRFLYSGESVLIPRKGSLNNIMLVSGDFWTIDTMFYGVPKKENIAKYVYHYLQIQDMAAHNIGAAVPSMTVTILSGINFMLPDDELLAQFENTVSPWYKEIENYRKAIKFAAEARDRLLPKLMSGEIEAPVLP